MMGLYHLSMYFQNYSLFFFFTELLLACNSLESPENEAWHLPMYSQVQNKVISHESKSHFYFSKMFIKRGKTRLETKPKKLML